MIKENDRLHHGIEVTTILFQFNAITGWIILFSNHKLQYVSALRDAGINLKKITFSDPG